VAVGAEVNHQILVSEFDGVPVAGGPVRGPVAALGDGLLNTDGAYHRDFRMLLLPAFHRDYIAAMAETLIQQTLVAVEMLREGQVVEIYRWVRELALRIALRGLLGMEANEGRERTLAAAFEASLAIHGEPVLLQMLPAPRTPLARAIAAQRTLDLAVRAEIEERRRRGDAGRGVLGLLLSATDDGGVPLSTSVIRDQAITLLFAGHDTTTTTFTFLAHELGRNPPAREAVEAELDRVLGARGPTAVELDGSALPVLERSLKADAQALSGSVGRALTHNP
jgi:cytochrome P450